MNGLKKNNTNYEMQKTKKEIFGFDVEVNIELSFDNSNNLLILPFLSSISTTTVTMDQ